MRYVMSEYVSDSYLLLIQVHDLLHFFPRSGNHLSFIWGSAKSGFMHLYHVTISLESFVSETSSPDDTGFNNMSLHPSESF